MQGAHELWDWRRTVASMYRDVREGADPRAGWAQWCAVRARLFRQHPQSPIEAAERAAYRGPFVFDYDPGLRLRVRLGPAEDERLVIATGADGETTLSAFARTAGLADRFGGELTLYWIEQYGGGVLLPFVDATSGSDSYGGGRYLIDSIKGADPVPCELATMGRATTERATVCLDFNFAYFPSCAYSPRWVCPLAPRSNRLPAAVRGGERNPF